MGLRTYQHPCIDVSIVIFRRNAIISAGKKMFLWMLLLTIQDGLLLRSWCRPKPSSSSCSSRDPSIILTCKEMQVLGFYCFRYFQVTQVFFSVIIYPPICLIIFSNSCWGRRFVVHFATSEVPSSGTYSVVTMFLFSAQIICFCHHCIKFLFKDVNSWLENFNLRS